MANEVGLVNILVEKLHKYNYFNKNKLINVLRNSE